MTGVSFAYYVSVDLIHWLGLGMGVIIGLVVLYELVRWRAILSPIGRAATKLSPSNWWSIFFRTLLNDTAYQQIEVGCGRLKWISHSLVFWGFLALVASTTTDYIINPSGAWLPITNIVRVLGNFGGILISAGLVIVIYRARSDADKRSYTTGADYFFISLLVIATLTGWLTEFTGELGALEWIYPTYVIHLMMVGVLLFLAPFTRFIHAIGRPVLRLSERYLEALAREGAVKPFEIQSPPLLGAEGA